MRVRTWIAMIALVGLGACGYPALSSSMRSNFPPEADVEMKCWELAERGKEGLNRMLSVGKKEGWKLAFISEYTSTAKTSFPTIVCFERLVN